MPKIKTLKPPKAEEVKHLKTMRHIWRVSQSIIQRGIDPLLLVWPVRGDVLPFPGEVTAEAPIERPRGFSPLAPAGRVPRIWNLSDADLKKLWPEVRPELVREYAPWAVSYREVERLTAGRGTPAELQQRVAAAIELEREMRPRPVPALRLVESTRMPGAFRLRYSPEAMAIFGPEGPVGPPPIPSTAPTLAVIPEIIDLRSE